MRELVSEKLPGDTLSRPGDHRDRVLNSVEMEVFEAFFRNPMFSIRFEYSFSVAVRYAADSPTEELIPIR